MGPVDKSKEECRDLRPTRIIRDLAADLRYAGRGLRRNPGFAALATVSHDYWQRRFDADPDVLSSLEIGGRPTTKGVRSCVHGSSSSSHVSDTSSRGRSGSVTQSGNWKPTSNS